MMIDRIKSYIFSSFYSSYKKEVKRLKEIIRKHEAQVPYDDLMAKGYVDFKVHEISRGRELKFAVAHSGLNVRQMDDTSPFEIPSPGLIACRLETSIGICNMIPDTEPELGRARKELIINLARGLGKATEEQFLKSVNWR